MSIKTLRRQLLQRLRQLSPVLAHRIDDYQGELWVRSLQGGSVYRAKLALDKAYGNKVIDGPFKNMRYGQRSVGSAYVPKIIGCYEEELYDVIESVISKNPHTVIDIGCAEGYYAVGLALRLPTVKVYAYDCDERAQRYCRRAAEANGVAKRVIIKGLCDHKQLDALSQKGTFILCDCEGGEYELLDPSQCPSLLSCDILVELHEFLQPGLTDAVLSRFTSTHSLQLINTTERDPAKYPVLSSLNPEDSIYAVDEGRPAPMQWAYLTANDS